MRQLPKIQIVASPTKVVLGLYFCVVTIVATFLLLSRWDCNDVRESVLSENFYGTVTRIKTFSSTGMRVTFDDGSSISLTHTRRIADYNASVRIGDIIGKELGDSCYYIIRDDVRKCYYFDCMRPR